MGFAATLGVFFAHFGYFGCLFEHFSSILCAQMETKAPVKSECGFEHLFDHFGSLNSYKFRTFHFFVVKGDQQNEVSKFSTSTGQSFTESAKSLPDSYSRISS